VTSESVDEDICAMGERKRQLSPAVLSDDQKNHQATPNAKQNKLNNVKAKKNVEDSMTTISKILQNAIARRTAAQQQQQPQQQEVEHAENNNNVLK
jgi:hypothetical protein